jgi:hypothetical protein
VSESPRFGEDQRRRAMYLFWNWRESKDIEKPGLEGRSQSVTYQLAGVLLFLLDGNLE